MEGKKEMKGILWLTSGAIRWYCLRVCLVAENKTEKKKKSFFFSLSKALFGCWEMNLMTFVAEKMKGKNRKSDFWTFWFLFYKFLTLTVLSLSDGLFGGGEKQRGRKGEGNETNLMTSGLSRLCLYDIIAWESVWSPRTEQREQGILSIYDSRW